MPKKKKEVVLKKQLKNNIDQKVAESFFTALARNGGNSTKAAMEVFGYTEQQEWQANIVGKRMLQRLAPTRDEYISYTIEKKTGGIDWFIDQMLRKVEKSNSTEWWDRAMKLAGYFDFTKQSKEVNINVGSTHDKYVEKYIDGEIEADD